MSKLSIFIVKIIVLSLFLQNLLFAYVDSDFDGVGDKYDKCPNTPFSELVDSEGCTIKKVSVIQEIGKLTLLFGANYSDYHSQYGNKTETLSESIELNYEIDRIKIMLYVSHFSSDNDPLSVYDDSSFSDTRLSLSYVLKQKVPNLKLSFGAGVAIPNYKGAMGNNGFDFYYSLNANYFLGKNSLFASYTYTIIGDKDLSYLSYQNTNSLNFGVGRSFKPNIYSSISLYIGDSIIKKSKRIKNISCFTYYGINKKLFSTFSFTHGLNADTVSNNYGLKFGYRI